MPDKSSFLSSLRDDPATKALMSAGRNYAAARAGSLVTKAGEKLSGTGGDGDGDVSVKDKLTGGAMSGAGEATSAGKGKLGKIFGGIGGAVKGLFKKGRGANKRPTNIVEDIWIGLPPQQVYDKWHDYAAHAGYTKGITAVDVIEEAAEPDEEDGEEQQEETSWKAKVFWSNRSWKATTLEDVPGERIKWKTEGAKGTLDGVITFTPLAENATLMLVVLEYRPKGFMEWTANRWRAAGRRVRLDLKHFRRFVMMEDLDEQQPEPDEPDDESTDDNEVDQNGPEGEDTESAEADDGDSETGPTDAPETDAEAAEAGADEPDPEPDQSDESEPPKKIAVPRRPARPKTAKSGAANG